MEDGERTGGMTPERKAELVALRIERDRLGEIFKEARDNWTAACSRLNYAMLEELDYYQYIKGIKKIKPDWYAEVSGEKPRKEVVTRRQADALVEQMLKQAQKPEKREVKRDSSWKSLW